MAYYILAGLIGVLNMILWGLYGDLLAEKFSIWKVVRSLCIGIFWSIFVFITEPNLPLFIVALVVISLERITTEIYKALIRNEDQSKYEIPSDFNLKLNPKIKLLFGVLLLVGLAAAVYYIEIPINNILLVVGVGTFTAIGGMLKDAPFEGFDPIKFFRSPMVALAVGFLILALFPDASGKFLLLATAGGERIISEFYKKILNGRVPGKFKQKELFKSWRTKRKPLLFLYALDILALAILVKF